MLVAEDIRRLYGERYQDLYVVLLGKLCQGRHLLGIKRTDDEVTLGGILVVEKLGYVGFLSYIPGIHIHRKSCMLKTVYRHQHSTIIFHHTATVAVLVVQREHHTYTEVLGIRHL